MNGVIPLAVSQPIRADDDWEGAGGTRRKSERRSAKTGRHRRQAVSLEPVLAATRLSAGKAGNDAEQRPLPPVCSSQGRVFGSDPVFLAATGTNDQRLVGLHRDDPPELLDGVRIVVTVRCRVNVSGMRPGVLGALCFR